MILLDQLNIPPAEQEATIDAFVAAYQRYWPPVPVEEGEDPPPFRLADPQTFTPVQREQIVIDAFNELAVGVVRNHQRGRYG